MTDAHTTEQDLVDALHVAIDFETLSLSPRAAIVGVAAAVFGEPEWPQLLFSAWPIACGLHPVDLHTVETRSNLAGTLTSPQQPSREIDSETIAWHRRQRTWSTTVDAFEGRGLSIESALRQLVDTVKHVAGDRPVLWYSRPSAFDGAVLLDLSRWSSDFRDAEAQLGGPARVPLHRRVRCMRTLQHDVSLVSGAPMLWCKADVPHDPRSDVMADAVSAHECLRVLRLAGELFPGKVGA